jgi:hypothetical protein
MALDSFINMVTYVGANHPHNKVTGNVSIRIGNTKLPINIHDVVYVTSRAMSFHNLYQIHMWFVSNVQDGEDDAGEYRIPFETLQELRNVIQEVVEKHDDTTAQNLLPLSYYDDTSFDKVYYRQLYMARKQIDNFLKNLSDDIKDRSYLIYKSSF